VGFVETDAARVELDSRRPGSGVSPLSDRRWLLHLIRRAGNVEQTESWLDVQPSTRCASTPASSLPGALGAERARDWLLTRDPADLLLGQPDAPTFRLRGEAFTDEYAATNARDRR
jgi:hypothetical protein